MAGLIIRYEDGSSKTVEIKPKHMIAAERAIGKPVADHGVEASYLSAWKASGSTAKFDDWLDTVETLEQVEADADPTPAPSPDE